MANLLNLANVEISPDGARAVAVAGRYAYVANYNNLPGGTGLSIFDISNPRNPVDVGFNDHQALCSGACIYSNAAYVIYGGVLTVQDISNPTNPTPIGTFSGGYSRMRAYGRFLYLTGDNGNGESGLFIYDTSNPMNPTRIGVITNGSPMAVEFGGYMYANVSPIGWLVYDMATDKPRCVSVAQTTNYWTDNAVASSDFAYCAGVSNRLNIYNVSNPTNPVLVCEPLYVEASMLALSGNYLYAGAYHWSVLDVSNPTNATSPTWFGWPGGGNITVSGGYAYVAGYPFFSIHSLGTPPPPPLSISRSSTNTLVLTWPAPNPAFAVQQNADLNTDNWVTLPDTPFVVASRNEIIIPVPASRMFHRLVSQ